MTRRLLVGAVCLVLLGADTKGTMVDTQSTAANLNANVSQATAASLNATVVQGTAANLNAAVVGTKTNNNAAPGATNEGVLPGLANAANPSWTEGNQVNLSVDLTGAQRVVLRTKATYVSGLLLKTATAAGTGVWFSICGSASKTVRIQRFNAAATVATAAAYADVILRVTSAATSGGTPTALVRVPLDSNSAAATVATPNFYTVLATAGTVVGTIGSRLMFAPLTATPAMAIPADFSWYDRVESEAPVLRGTAQCVVASFGTTTTNVPTMTVEVTWTEE